MKSSLATARFPRRLSQLPITITTSTLVFKRLDNRLRPTQPYRRNFACASVLNMKEAIVSKGPKVTIHEIDIPKPNADQVLIKVICSGSNPKDWKRPEHGEPHNSGDDIAGIVEAVGENVVEFKTGDRVAAFHEMMSPSGSFAEYALAWAYTTFHLPKNTSFEEGASIPLAAMTAAVGMYLRLKLPEPWQATTEKLPLIVYGASGAVGAYAIKLAQASNIHPIIAVAGKGQSFVEGLLSKDKGDTFVDYRNGDEAVVTGIKKALEKAGVSEVKHAYDAVAQHNSYQNICKVLAPQGSQITLVTPGKDYSEIPENIKHSVTMVAAVHSANSPNSPKGKAGIQLGGKEFGYVYFRLFSKGLQDGWFTAHPYEVVPGGLNGIEEGLSNLKNGVNSASKYVFRIPDTK